MFYLYVIVSIIIFNKLYYNFFFLYCHVRAATHDDQRDGYEYDYINILYLEPSSSRNCELYIPKLWDQC